MLNSSKSFELIQFQKSLKKFPIKGQKHKRTKNLKGQKHKIWKIKYVMLKR